jgi:hypothetical protein
MVVWLPSLRPRRAESNSSPCIQAHRTFLVCEKFRHERSVSLRINVSKWERQCQSSCVPGHVDLFWGRDAFAWAHSNLLQTCSGCKRDLTLWPIH